MNISSRCVCSTPEYDCCPQMSELTEPQAEGEKKEKELYCFGTITPIDRGSLILQHGNVKP